MSKRRIYTRRDFLRQAAGGTAAMAMGLSMVKRASSRNPTRSAKVVIVRNADAVDGTGRVNEPILSEMLDDAVCALFGADDPKDAWKGILRLEDRLGIKSNVWDPLPTPAALENAIRERALQIGISRREISVDDRGVLDDPVFRRATALINVRPLRTHHWAGIGGCLKNYIMFTRTPSEWHSDSCADLGGLWKLPVVRGKTRLNVLVVLTPLFHGIGPHHFDPEHVWPYRGLLVGTDPVALDSIGVRLLEEQRKRFFERPPRGGTSTKHVRLADSRHGIGVADPDRIELIKIGWMEDALI
jgi:hypothetical protein